MSLKGTVLQRNCNSLCLTEKNPVTDSLTNILFSQRRQSASADKISTTSRIPIYKNSSLLNSLKKKNHKDESPNEIISSVPHCLGCSTTDAVQKLEDEVQDLTFQMNKQRNDNLILKRRILVAKKVTKNEIGANKGEEFDFDVLLKNACSERWMGRQKMIFVLNRKLKELNEAVELMESNVKVPSKKTVTHKKECEKIFPDEKTTIWCLEQERRNVWRNVERNKQKMIKSRDTTRNHLDRFITRNKDLMEEATSLRKKLSIISKSTDERQVERLNDLESRVKAELGEKIRNRRELDFVEQQISRNCEALVELKEKIRLEKDILNDTEERIKSLNANETVLNAATEDIKNEGLKQWVCTKNNLKMAEQNYSLIATKSEHIMKLTSDGKRLLEKLKPSQLKDCARTLSDMNELKAGNQLEDASGSEISSEVFGRSFTNVKKYEDELARCKFLLEKLERRNQQKLHYLYNNANKTEDANLTFLKNRYVFWKLATETDLLQNRMKRLKMSAHPSMQKFSKKKETNHLWVEILKEMRTCQAILKIENKILKTHIRSVFGSKGDDCELLESFLNRNRSYFLKGLSNFKA